MTTAIHPMGFVNIIPREISMAHEAHIANRSRLWGARVSSYARPVAVHLPAMGLNGIFSFDLKAQNKLK